METVFCVVEANVLFLESPGGVFSQSNMTLDGDTRAVEESSPTLSW